MGNYATVKKYSNQIQHNADYVIADAAGIGFYIIRRIFSILRLCSAPVVIM